MKNKENNFHFTVWIMANVFGFVIANIEWSTILINLIPELKNTGFFPTDHFYLFPLFVGLVFSIIQSIVVKKFLVSKSILSWFFSTWIAISIYYYLNINIFSIYTHKIFQTLFSSATIFMFQPQTGVIGLSCSSIESWIIIFLFSLILGITFGGLLGFLQCRQVTDKIDAKRWFIATSLSIIFALMSNSIFFNILLNFGIKNFPVILKLSGIAFIGFAYSISTGLILKGRKNSFD